MSLNCVVYVTAPAGDKAEAVAREVVKRRLAACVNIVPSVKSIYRWEGKMTEDNESLLIIKTKKSLLKKLINQVVLIHPYDVPEIIALPIIDGHKPYLDWLKKEAQ
jgi:periplasmic divalent cation tolerance protein